MISEETIEEVKRIANELRPYYRIMLRKGELIICQLQPDDEFDYDESEWITEHKFYDVEENYVEEIIIAVYCFIDVEHIYIYFDDERQNIIEEIYDNILKRAELTNTGKEKLKRMLNNNSNLI